MKSAFLSIVGFLTLFNISSASATAGGMEGGGGKSVVCRNGDGTIRSAEILDLYEGRVVYQLSYKESREEWRSQAVHIFEAAGISTNYSTDGTIYMRLANAFEHLTFVPIGTELRPTNDSYEVVAPRGCGIEQAVNYQNDNLILVSTEIWSALSETQRASLLIHESVYRFLRDHGETDSRRARHFNAYLVSGGHVEPTFPGNGWNVMCSSPQGGTTFYATALPADNLGVEKVRLEFASIGGRLLLSRSYMDIQRSSPTVPGEPPFDLLEQLRVPTQWTKYMPRPTNSLFEPGDSLELWLNVNQGKVQLQGTSIFDESKIPLTDLSCWSRGH